MARYISPELFGSKFAARWSEALSEHSLEAAQKLPDFIRRHRTEMMNRKSQIWPPRNEISD